MRLLTNGEAETFAYAVAFQMRVGLQPRTGWSSFRVGEPKAGERAHFKVWAPLSSKFKYSRHFALANSSLE